MEAERERPEREEYPIPRDLPEAEGKKQEPRVSLGTQRCPYCHSDVNPAASDWVACKACLARHHGACWSERGRCASCQRSESLSARPAAPAGRSRGWLAYGAVALFLALVGLGVAQHVRAQARIQDLEYQLSEMEKAEAIRNAHPHLRAYFKRKLEYDLNYLSPDRKRRTTSTIGIFTEDVFAMRVAEKINAGSHVEMPSPTYCADLFRRVIDLYKQDGVVDEDVADLQMALEKLEPPTEKK